MESTGEIASRVRSGGPRARALESRPREDPGGEERRGAASFTHAGWAVYSISRTTRWFTGFRIRKALFPGSGDHHMDFLLEQLARGGARWKLSPTVRPGGGFISLALQLAAPTRRYSGVPGRPSALRSIHRPSVGSLTAEGRTYPLGLPSPLAERHYYVIRQWLAGEDHA